MRVNRCFGVLAQPKSKELSNLVGITVLPYKLT